MDERTLATLLERAAGTRLGVRFVDESGTGALVPWAAIRDRALARAAWLHGIGVEPGDRVAVVLPTSPGFLDAFFGCVLGGAVPAPLPPPERLGRLAEYQERTAALLRGIGVRLVLTDARTRTVLGRAVADAAPELGCRAVGPAGRGTGPGGGGSGPVALDSDGTAFIQHSSGTTGLPRPIRLSHRAVLANLDAIRERILAAHPESDASPHAAAGWIPLHHDMGLVGSLLTSLAHPVDLALIPPQLFVRSPAVWLRTIARCGATVSAAPNFAYGLCVDRITDEELAGVDLSCWKVALTGAEPVAPRTLRRFAERFARFGFRSSALTPVYGLAEATLAVTFSDPRTHFRTGSFDPDRLARDGRAVPADPGLEIASVGRPLPRIELRIEAGGPHAREPEPVRAAEAGEVGRVLVRGPSLLQGGDGAADGPIPLRDGWLDTGDTGFLLDGELFLYGRAKDVIVLRGRKHPPHQVERSLDGLAGARTGCSAAFGVVPAEGEEELVVLLERRRGGDPEDDAELARLARRRIVDRTGLVPGMVRVLEPGTLPRTSSGKIRRGEARRRFLACDLRPPEKVTALRLLRETAVSVFRLARLRRARGRPGARRP
ncbi:MAG: AMP-binding protein [Gemmatimonadota bacterium]